MAVKKSFLLIAGLIFYNSLVAQLCQGSLGDPVVNNTFGSGQGFGSPLGASITNYTYAGGDCPNDGSYTIESSTNNCFGGGWFSVPEDHTTGDMNGFMMVVNASYTAGDFYVDTVRGLCGGTTYEFAAWIMNVLKPSSCNGIGNKPNITFRIESLTGTILQTYTTGDIAANASPLWLQYGMFFNTPSATTSVVLRMTNNAPGGCGNDLMLDDITFRPCGPKITVSINGTLVKKSFCSGDTSTLSFSSTIIGGYSNPFYQWQQSPDGISWTDINGANTINYSRPAISVPGNYFFRLTAAQANNIFIPTCRIASEPVEVTIDSLPVPAASNSGPACENKSISLNATGGNIYDWTGPGNFTSNQKSPVITNTSLLNNGKYYVKVTTVNGCFNIDSTVVVIKQNPSVVAGGGGNICEGAGIVLQGSTNAASWIWSPPGGLSDALSLTPTAKPGKTTLYILTVKNGACINADSVLIKVTMKPTADAGPDKLIVGNQQVMLEGKATGTNSYYYWTPIFFLFPDSVLQPVASPPFDTVYTLHVVSRDGCGEATDKVLVKYFKEVYIPNAFSPNKDGLNDRWNITALTAFPTAELNIYNRFGQLIFHDKGFTQQWDGTIKGRLQPAGAYCYTIDLKNGSKILFGIVMLIR